MENKNITRLKVGRLGLTDNGAVVIGDVTSVQFSIIQDEAELKDELTKYNRIICAGMMNTMFTNNRLIDWLMDNYTEKDILSKFISSFNIKYYSELNRYTTFKHLFLTNEQITPDGKLVRTVYQWGANTIKDWTFGYKSMIGKLTILCLMDFVKSTCSLEKYMEFRKINGLIGFMMNPDILLEDNTLERNTKTTSIVKSKNRSKLWKRNNQGHVLLVGCGQGNEFIMHRYSGGLLESSDSDVQYKISLNGFMSKLRYELGNISIQELILKSGGSYNDELDLEQNIDNNYYLIENFGCSMNNETNKPCKGTDYISMLYNMLLDLRNTLSNIHIYEINRDRITFIVRGNTDIQTVLERLYYMLHQHFNGLFETLIVGEINPHVSYLNAKESMNTINIKDIRKLSHADIPVGLSVNPNVSACAIFDLVKSMH